MLGKSSSGRTSSEAPDGVICAATDVRIRDRRPILPDVRARLWPPIKPSRTDRVWAFPVSRTGADHRAGSL